MKKIAYFSNTDFSLYNFRLGLIRKMKERDFKVVVCGSITKKELPKKIQEKGIKFINLSLRRSFDWLGGDILYFFKVFFLCRKEKINICHNFTIKPCIYASLAQKLAGVPEIYCTITGLGYVFQESNLKTFSLKKIIIFFYKFSFKFVNKVIFQNPDDRELFIKLGIINKRKTIVVKSSGVDLNKFSLNNVDKKGARKIKIEVGIKKTSIVITLIARMLWQKGIKEFVETAKKLNKKYNNLIFLLVGPIDKENPSRIPRKIIEKWKGGGVIKYLGERRDIKEILAITDIFAFPSYYREGVPRVLLEAGAMEKPLIAANVVGSKEVVESGVNGFLVRPKDIESLASALEKLITNKELRISFGKEARKKIIKNFSEEKVIKETFKVYNF